MTTYRVLFTWHDDPRTYSDHWMTHEQAVRRQLQLHQLGAERVMICPEPGY